MTTNGQTLKIVPDHLYTRQLYGFVKIFPGQLCVTACPLAVQWDDMMGAAGRTCHGMSLHDGCVYLRSAGWVGGGGGGVGSFGVEDAGDEEVDGD